MTGSGSLSKERQTLRSRLEGRKSLQTTKKNLKPSHYERTYHFTGPKFLEYAEILTRISSF